MSAQQLADDLGCEELTSALLDPEEPVLPSQSLGCRIGEANFGIRLYESTDDRDLVLDYLHQFAGYRNIGPNWIVAVDTPESAQRATEALGGDFVTLQGGVVE